MTKKVAIILINYKDYAKKYLPECIKSLRRQDYGGEMKIYIVDNVTSPATAVYLAETAPEAELILNKNNDGFAKGNNDAMKLALAAGFDYIILFNMDTVIAPDCVKELTAVVEKREASKKPEIGAVQARLMLWPEKEKINSLGNAIHFLGFGFGSGYREEYKKQNPADICYPSGAAVLFPRAVLEEAGLFDEEFWMYNEDQDLGWRIRLSGRRCILAPAAVVYHKYKFTKSIKQYYWMDRNRIIAVIKNYHWLSLLLIAPAFLGMEMGLFIFALCGGWPGIKLRVWGYFLRPRTWVYLVHARQRAQSLRRVRDGEVTKIFFGRICHQEVDNWKLRLVNPLLASYWRLVYKIIKWAGV